MKRLLLELGGKGAAIVFDDADLEDRGRRHRRARGPSTPARSAPRRPGCIAQRGIYDQLVGKLAGMAAAPEGRRPARARHGRRPGHHRRAPRPRRGLRRSPAVDEGADRRRRRRAARRSTPASTSRPTLLADATNDMTAVQEEIFGPVVVVVPFDDEDEAVALANGSRLRPLRLRVLAATPAGPCAVAQQLRSRQRRHQHRCSATTRRRSAASRRAASAATAAPSGLHAYSELQSIVWPG